ncbi:hypothetical protein [Aliarcobacter cryaerophilus]|uniref:hypothetical protein n=1 Tax=Aliarcobacter cryaerophilus TaxID=28198 RepID=UPI0011E01874|nr:hypothetical protein [Aliarcobacter cryaerophilus]
MESNIYSRTNIFITGLFLILAGIITIIDPSYTKWGTDETSNTLIGIYLTIFGFIVTTVQGISIFRKSKKDTKKDSNDNN